MSRTEWRAGIEDTQRALREHHDSCLICGREVPQDCPACLVQAYRDQERHQRLAVVCDRADCRQQLEDPRNETWQALFEGLMHWPDPAIQPLGPYWTVQRHHRFTFRTDPRRTTYTG